MRKGFPGGSGVKNLPEMQETRFNPWVGRIPWKRKWQSTPVFFFFFPQNCLGNSTDRGDWRATVHRVSKESDTTEQLNNNHSLEEASETLN